MTTRSSLIGLALLSTGVPVNVALASWGSVRGDGHARTEARAVTGFDQVANDTSLGLDIVQGDTFEVQVTTDGNLLPLVLTTVKDGQLRIHADQSFSTSAKSFVHVVLPSLTGVQSAGSGDVSIHGVRGGKPLKLVSAGSGQLTFEGTAGDLVISSAGSGPIVLEGRAGQLAVDVAGSGSVDGTHFQATGAKVEVAGSGSLSLNVNGDASVDDLGSGDVRVTLSGTLNARVMGSGGVQWAGAGHEGRISQMGSGHVVHREAL